MKLLSHGPEPCASANSATSATARVIITHINEKVKRFLKIFHKNILLFFKKISKKILTSKDSCGIIPTLSKDSRFTVKAICSPAEEMI